MTFLRSLHRWVGLLLAAVVVAVALSGGLLLLREPFYRATYPAVAAPVTPAQIATRADVLTAIESRWEGEGVRLIKFPRPGMNVFHVWLRDGTEAFVDPQNGAVIDRWLWHERVPAFLFELHAHLVTEPGGTIVNGVVALFVLFMALTGVLFWWPARRGAFRLQGFFPRRLGPAELLRSHAAAGVIAAVPIVLFAGTGAAIVFYDEAAAVVTRLLDADPAEQPDARVPRLRQHAQPWSAILARLDATFAEGRTVFYYPGTEDNARLLFRKQLPGEWHPNGRSYVVMNPYTAEVVQAIDARAQGAGTRLMHAIYPVHAAKVGGAPMVLLATLAAFALTWLCVTGVWSYAGRWLTSRIRTKPLSFRGSPTVRAPSHSAAAVRLSEVPVGYSARLLETRLDAESRLQLRALGLTDASLLRVCKQGEPCVIQVRTTRVGMSSRIAQQVLVIPFEDEKVREMSWQ